MNAVKVKKCRICNEPASGFNFGGQLSCEACKLFFYRNASKIDKLKCYRKFKCEISTKQNRKHCCKCRLLKCQRVGMKLNVNSKTSDQLVKTTTVKLNRIEKVFESILHDKICESLQIDGSEASKNEKTLVENFKPCSRKRATNLSKYELDKIKSIQKGLSVFDNENNLPVDREASGLMEGINIPTHYVKKIIQFCKSIPEFNCLKANDTLVILKQFTCDLMFVRSTFMFDTTKNGFYYTEDEKSEKVIFIPWDKCYNFKNQDLVRSIKSIGHLLKKQMEKDEVIRDLIIAQFLFKPRKNLSCNEFLKYHNTLYKILLQKYLEQKKRSINKAKYKFYSLNALLENIAQIKEKERFLMLNEIDSQQIPHIMAEIYNL